MKNSRGFTLIELLVVISIISLLASIVLASLNSARVKARDARRVVDIKQIQTALDFFYDQYGRYIISGQCGATTPNTGWSNSVQCLSAGHWLRDSTYNLGEFLATDSVDPINQNNWLRGAYYYFAQGYGASDGAWYMMVYSLENYPNLIIENSAAGGVKAPNGRVFKYGSGSNGVLTVGRSK